MVIVGQDFNQGEWEIEPSCWIEIKQWWPQIQILGCRRFDDHVLAMELHATRDK